MFKSATLKLTLWYVLLITSLSLLFSFVLYHFATHELAEGLQRQYQVLITNDHDQDNDNLPHTELGNRSQHLLSDLVYFNVAVIAGSTFVSYVLARRTLRPIEEAHQAQVRFTAEASHELRTPLTAIKAGTEVALMERADDNMVLRRTLQDNLRDIEKLELLAHHLLDISRFQTKKAEPNELLDLDVIVSEVLKQFKHPMSEKRLKSKINLQPVQVRGDQYGIKQLLTIVLDNAIKYSHLNGIVTVKLNTDGKYAVITVTDKGIGIPAADLPHIFKRFYRSKNITKDNNLIGYGLGLSIAREISQLHKGSIDIRSQENKGTTVTIKLLVAKQ